MSPKSVSPAPLNHAPINHVSTDQHWSTMWQRTLQNLDLLPIDAIVESRRLKSQSRIRRLEVLQGMVSAEVQDRKHGLCKITISFAPLSIQAWTQLVAIFHQQAVGALQIDAQVLFSEKEPTFPQVSALLLALAPDELVANCSCCSAKGEHCPALQAIYHQIGIMLDEEPVLLLRLRGREWQALAQALQAYRLSNHPGTTAAVTGHPRPTHPRPTHPRPTHPRPNAHAEVDAHREAARDENALDAQPGNFWGSRRALETFHHHITPPQIELAILRRLGPLPDLLNDRGVDQALATLYRHVTREAEALAYDLDAVEESGASASMNRS